MSLLSAARRSASWRRSIRPKTQGEKVYALYCGLVLLVAAGTLFALWSVDLQLPLARRG
ncbi:MAG: hypothetical protein ACJ79V_24025 [Myxococcales bacterium]